MTAESPASPPPATGRPPAASSRPGRPAVEPADVAEHGADGQTSHRRLFLRLTCYTGGHAPAVAAAADAVASSGLEGVVYADAADPAGLAVLAITEDPAVFAGAWRELLLEPPFDSLTPRPTHTMLGRTYALGYEPDLDDTLLARPRRHALDPATPWAVWYPLRRKAAFERLPPEDKMRVYREHGAIGMSFAAAGLARDVRLACHGLSAGDDDFVIGLMGPELAPLSLLVQKMRGTEQTALHLDKLGPFFVGHAAWRSPVPGATSPA